VEVAVAARTFSDGRRALGSTVIRGMIGASTIQFWHSTNGKCGENKAQSVKSEVKA